MGMIPTFIALITIIVAGAVTVSGTFFSESSHVVESLAQDADRVQELRGTRIELIGASYASPYADLVFRNTGRVAHSDFDRWDVWASFHEADGSYHPERLTYSSTAGSSPAADEWVIEGIYLDADAGIAESSQPGIFGPSEEVRVRLHVDPAAGDPQVNSVTVGLANGVTAKAGFTWEALATVPADVGAGGSLTNDGTYVYGLMGGNASDFGRYDPSSASWTSLTDAPWTPRGGGDGLRDRRRGWLRVWVSGREPARFRSVRHRGRWVERDGRSPRSSRRRRRAGLGWCPNDICDGWRRDGLVLVIRRGGK
jgi:hypothetical protein